MNDLTRIDSLRFTLPQSAKKQKMGEFSHVIELDLPELSAFYIKRVPEKKKAKKSKE